MSSAVDQQKARPVLRPPGQTEFCSRPDLAIPRPVAPQQSRPPFHQAPGLYPRNVRRLFDSVKTSQTRPPAHAALATSTGPTKNNDHSSSDRNDYITCSLSVLTRPSVAGTKAPNDTLAALLGGSTGPDEAAQRDSFIAGRASGTATNRPAASKVLGLPVRRDHEPLPVVNEVASSSWPCHNSGSASGRDLRLDCAVPSQFDRDCLQTVFAIKIAS